MNPKQLAQNIIERAMKMQTFRIVRTLPDDFEINGPIPFDIRIKDGIINVTVQARTLEEANKQVDDYLEENTGI